MKTVDKILKDARDVILRVDYNFPRAIDGSVSDITRIEQTRRTIEFLWNAKKRVRILTHWGRPDGWDESLSVRHLVPHVAKFLGRQVFFDDQPLTEKYNAVDEPLTLCENVRFYPGETRNDLAFVKYLTQRGDVFVNDAFPVCHRNHASVCGLLKAMPSYLGFGCAYEWESIQDVRQRVSEMVVVVGGNKIETKLPLICTLLPSVQKVLLGPLIAKGMQSFLSQKHTDVANKSYVDALKKYPEKITTPLDVCTLDGVRDFDAAYELAEMKDIGPRTIEAYTDAIFDSGVVFMNGPLGQYEISAGAQGTYAIGDAIAHVAKKEKEFYALLGGGDTIAALGYTRKRWPNNVCLSPSGGALLHAMTYGTLPGLEGLCG